MGLKSVRGLYQFIMDEKVNSIFFYLGTDLLNKRREAVMLVDDSEARSSDTELSNSFDVTRSDYLESCIAAACSLSFK